MGLSEHEEKAFDKLRQALEGDDPEFVKRASRIRRGWQLESVPTWVFGLIFVVGLVEMLFTFVASTALGLVGVLIMFGAAYFLYLRIAGIVGDLEQKIKSGAEQVRYGDRRQ